MNQINSIPDVGKLFQKAFARYDKEMLKYRSHKTGCPRCGTSICKQLSPFPEITGPDHFREWKPEHYSSQFEPGNYVCENGHSFSVNDEGETI